MRSGSRTGFWRMMTWWWTRNEFDEHKYFEKRESKKVIYFLIFKKSLPLSFEFFSNLFFLYLLWCISLCFLDNLLKWVETGVPGVKPPEPVIEVVENINAYKRKAKISSPNKTFEYFSRENWNSKSWIFSVKLQCLFWFLKVTKEFSREKKWSFDLPDPRIDIHSLFFSLPFLFQICLNIASFRIESIDDHHFLLQEKELKGCQPSWYTSWTKTKIIKRGGDWG